MSKALTALNALRGERANLQRDPVRLAIDGHRACAGLLKTLELLKEARFDLLVSQPPLNPGEVWKFWEAHGFDLKALHGLQTRTLCTAAETALEPDLAIALDKHPDILRTPISLFG